MCYLLFQKNKNKIHNIALSIVQLVCDCNVLTDHADKKENFISNQQVHVYNKALVT